MENATAITTPFSNQRGFTLIEALTAIVILILGILSLYTMHMGSITANARADSVSRLSSWATDRIEAILAGSISYDQLLKIGNRPGKVASAANEFALNNPLVANGAEPNYLQLGMNCVPYEGGNLNITRADLCQASTDGRGLVFLNIAPDVPAAGIIAVRAKVVTRDFGQPVVTSTTYFITNTTPH